MTMTVRLTAIVLTVGFLTAADAARESRAAASLPVAPLPPGGSVLHAGGEGHVSAALPPQPDDPAEVAVHQPLINRSMERRT
jgi:hypothetical protein